MKNNNRRAFIQKALLATGGAALQACQTEPSYPPQSKPQRNSTELPPSKPSSTPLPDGLREENFHLHNPTPLALESLRNKVGMSPITSTNRLFVRNNLPRPSQDIITNADQWELKITGVKNPSTISLPQLQQLGIETVYAVLQCSGNGRAFFKHAPSGSPWATGAAGCVQWTGVKLSTVFEVCGGIIPNMKYLTATGGEPLPEDVPRDKAIVERSIPIEKALKDCILAWELNGEPIPISHGGPLRLIVPGYFGCNQIKYVQQVAATKEQSQAKIQQSGYRFRPIGEKGNPSQPSMWRMPVKSWIVNASEDQARNLYSMHGVAFSGERGISSVEFSIDGENWKQAELYGIDLGSNAWRCFRFQTDPQIKPKQVYTRATDALGDTQPKEHVENERGYGNNSWLDHAFILQENTQEKTQQDSVVALSKEQQEKGRALFTKEAAPPCGTCHTLNDAQTTAQIGPNLNQLQPTNERVQRAIENGVGAMPSYGQQLSQEDIKILSEYVAQSSKK